jgi:hypothetical protein
MKTIHWVTYLLMAATLFMVGCDLFAPKQQADFFECPPNNHIVACVPGTTLTGCEPVGSGETTLKLVDCQ